MDELLAQYDQLPLKCDGMTKVISFLLTENKIKHKVYAGTLTHNTVCIEEHFWIELDNGKTIDYRAQEFLGTSPNIPHGMFDKASFPEVVYNGQPDPTLMQLLFRILIEHEQKD